MAIKRLGSNPWTLQKKIRKYNNPNPARHSKARMMMKELYPDLDWELLIVHHIDGNPNNNRIENLKIIDRTEHRKEHKKMKV